MFTSDKIRFIRDKTGCGYRDCVDAYELADENVRIAIEYLELISTAVWRGKINHGQRMQWNKADYLEEAKRIVESEDKP